MSSSTRERILRASEPIFARHGAAATMRAIGRAAGLDNSSLYRHFPSKEALADALLARAAAELEEALAPLERDAPPRLATLVRAASELTERLARRPDAARIVLAWMAAAPARAARGRRDDPQAPPARALLVLVDWLTRARRSGTIRRAHVNEAAVTLLGGILVRAATAGTLLAGGEGEPDVPAARRARAHETAALVAGALRPTREEIPLRDA